MSSRDERLCSQSRELERLVPAHNFEGHRIMIDIALRQQPSNDIMPRTLLHEVLCVDYANHTFLNAMSMLDLCSSTKLFFRDLIRRYFCLNISIALSHSYFSSMTDDMQRPLLGEQRSQ